MEGFDLGSRASPVMEGFTPLDAGCTYTAGRGYGWKNARVWRTFDVLQPDPLYQDFICVEAGGLAIDVPDGRYRVIVNMDSPSGFWGEVQKYRRRALVLEGQEHAETMDMESFRKMGEFGLLGMHFPEEYGGQGADVVTTVLAGEALGEAGVDGGLTPSGTTYRTSATTLNNDVYKVAGSTGGAPGRVRLLMGDDQARLSGPATTASAPSSAPSMQASSWNSSRSRGEPSGTPSSPS